MFYDIVNSNNGTPIMAYFGEAVDSDVFYENKTQYAEIGTNGKTLYLTQ